MYRYLQQLHCKIVSLIAIVLMIPIAQSSAQSTITTLNTLSPTDSVAVVTFNFQNTNAYPVTITGVDALLSYYGEHGVSFWYKTTPLVTAPGNITIANGWTMLSTGTATGIEHLNINNLPQPLFQSLSLTVPANTTYGIAISAMSTVANASSLQVADNVNNQIITQAGCSIITNGTIGNGGYINTNVNIPGKAFVGSLHFKSAAPCMGTPTAATITGPVNVCPNRLFTLSAVNTMQGGAITYQWQRYNSTTAIWENIVGANDINYINTNGIMAPTQYRLLTLCATGNTNSTSNSITVNINSNPISGTYTINDKAPSSATNFRSFKEALVSLNCGVNGPVIFNVDPQSGPYTEQVNINSVNGASVTNTITIKGNGRYVQYHHSNNLESWQGVVYLMGAKYIIIDSLNVRTLNPLFGTGYSLLNLSKYDTIRNCFVDVQSVGTNGSISVVSNYGINMSNRNQPYFINYNNAAVNCFIYNNHIKGSDKYSSIRNGILDGLAYASDPQIFYPYLDSGNVITHNVIENFDYAGIQSNYKNGSLIAYNDIHRFNKKDTDMSNNLIGIYLAQNHYTNDDILNTIPNDSFKIVVIGNVIHDLSKSINSLALSGIVISDNNGYWYPNYTELLVSNNVIYNLQAPNVNPSNSTIVGIGHNNIYNINIYGNRLVKIYHNTIDINSNNGSGISVGIKSSCINTSNYINLDTV